MPLVLPICAVLTFGSRYFFKTHLYQRFGINPRPRLIFARSPSFSKNTQNRLKRRYDTDSNLTLSSYNGQTAKHLAKAYLKEKKTDTIDADILANLLIDGKFPTSMTPKDNPFIEIRSCSRRSNRIAEQIAKAKTRLKDELAFASLGMRHVFGKQSVFNNGPMHLMKLYPLPEDRQHAGVDEIAGVLATYSGNKYGKAEAEKRLAFDAKNPGDKRLRRYFRHSI